MNRRNFLKSASSGLFLLAAPAIVRSESLMKLPPRRKILQVPITLKVGTWQAGDSIFHQTEYQDMPVLNYREAQSFMYTEAGWFYEEGGIWKEVPWEGAAT